MTSFLNMRHTEDLICMKLCIKKRKVKIYIQPIYLVVERRANQSIQCAASYPDMWNNLCTENECQAFPRFKSSDVLSLFG